MLCSALTQAEGLPHPTLCMRCKTVPGDVSRLQRELGGCQVVSALEDLSLASSTESKLLHNVSILYENVHI